jgi:autophagy-related protein 18
MNRKRLVVVLEEKISIYDLQTMSLVHTIDTIPNPNAVCALAPTPERSYLVFPTNDANGELTIFDTVTLQTICAIQAHKAAVSCVAFNFDGTLLATASDKGTIIRVFSVPEAEALHHFRRGTYPANIFGISFNLQSNLLAVSSDSDTVHIFKLKKRKHSKYGLIDLF